MYPEEICKPMREDLTSWFCEMKSPDEVSSILDKNEGTVLVMVNSVCGCAGGTLVLQLKCLLVFKKHLMFLQQFLLVKILERQLKQENICSHTLLLTINSPF